MVVMLIVFVWLSVGAGVGWLSMLGLLGSISMFSLMSSLMVVSLGILWCCDNVLGLFTSMNISMGYVMVLVVSMLFWVWGELPKVLSPSHGVSSYLAHYSLMGVGGALGLMLPFMEVFSTIIRPLTLGVRLSTNMTSGHVLMIMVSMMMGVGIFSGLIVVTLGWVLMLLEVCVCLLQALVFSMLVLIYLD